MYPNENRLYDPDLNEKGYLQCIQLKQMYSKMDFDLVVLSPYKRTIKTFDLIRNQQTKQTILASSLIRERASITAGVVG